MRTDEKLKEICQQVTANFGDLHTAARMCGVSTHFLFQWMKDDPEASNAVEEAQRLGYMGLESAAIQRGVHGVEKDVYYKGAVVGQERVYSDSLLGKLLEARVPAFKKGEDKGNTFNGPTQINIMPRANNFDEWLLMKRRTLEDRANDAKALPAPDAHKVPEILQGDFIEHVPAPARITQLEGLL